MVVSGRKNRQSAPLVMPKGVKFLPAEWAIVQALMNIDASQHDNRENFSRTIKAALATEAQRHGLPWPKST